jgi:hypothetical protein
VVIPNVELLKSIFPKVSTLEWDEVPSKVHQFILFVVIGGSGFFPMFVVLARKAMRVSVSITSKRITTTTTRTWFVPKKLALGEHFGLHQQR